MIKSKVTKSSSSFSPKMASLHTRWQQIRLELLELTLSQPHNLSLNSKKHLLSA